MRYLADTGVLLRLFDTADPEHDAVLRLLKLIRERGDEVVTTPQNIAEFWNVSTRPASARGGYAQTVEATDRRVRFLERLGEVLPPSAEDYARWRELVTRHNVAGVAVHDARIAAAMTVAGVEVIISLNDADFERYDGVRAVRPQELLAELLAKSP